MDSYLKDLNKTHCCGCRACEQICGHKAITMQKDEEGFLYPLINQTQCTNCKLCHKVCPYSSLQNKIIKKSPKVYWGWAIDQEIRSSSSSGGLFSVIASIILQRNGVVYGSHMDSNWNIYHKEIKNIKLLPQLKGSKYAQSDTLYTYNAVKKQLQNNIWVYFVGTPCQIAGLKSYLGKEYSTLITTDLICHGVPTNELLKENIKLIEHKKKIQIIEYFCRNPKCWYQYESYKFMKDKKTYQYALPTPQLSSYYNSYLKGMTYRPSCYSCPFAQIPRHGDITLGDFWGVHSYFKNISNTDGVSLILFNTPNGYSLFEDIQKETILKECELENAIQHNSCLIKPTTEPPIRKQIYTIIKNKGYEQVAESLLKNKNYHKIKIKYSIINFTKRIHIHSIYKIIKKWIKRYL